MSRFSAWGVAALLAFVGAEASAQPAPGAAPAARTDLADSELQAFAKITLELHARTGASSEEMAQIISSGGLSVERYNAIASQMSADPAYAAQVNRYLVAAQRPPSPPNAATVPAAPPAARPTEGPGANLLQVLDSVCSPMVRTDKGLPTVAAAGGLTRDRRASTYSRPLGPPPGRLTVQPRGVNRTVCSATLRYVPSVEGEIVHALTVWAALHDPQLRMRRNDVANGADGVRRRTLSWEADQAGRNIGLVLVQLSRPDGTPLHGADAEATVLYSEQGGGS